MRPFEPDRWLEVDHCRDVDIAEKRRLMEDIPDKVFQALPDTGRAQAEVLARVTGFLRTHHPDRAIVADDKMPDLLRAALSVQEDLVIMRKSEAGWQLVAGSVCFPSSWSLQEKIGKVMHAVHAPVPGFSEGTRNAQLIERIFDNLQNGQPVERFNWSVYRDDALYHDDRSGERIDGDEACFLRVERQTLTKLDCGDILFTIRIHIDPFEALGEHRDRVEIATGFIELLRKMTPQELSYKGLEAGVEALVRRLEALVRS